MSVPENQVKQALPFQISSEVNCDTKIAQESCSWQQKHVVSLQLDKEYFSKY